MGLPALFAKSLALLDPAAAEWRWLSPTGTSGHTCNAGLWQHCLPGLVAVQAVPCWRDWCALGRLPSTWHWCQQTGQAGSYLLLGVGVKDGAPNSAPWALTAVSPCPMPDGSCPKH